MSSRIYTVIGVAAALGLMLGPGQGTAQSGSPAQAPPPVLEQAPRAPDAEPLGAAITYQGQLKNGGAAVNGICDFQFALYDALALGARIGTTQTVNSLSVTSGLFTTAIDFGPEAFNGDARFLDTQVRCPSGGGAFTALSPRQALRAAPYALHSAGPWATGISNTLSYTRGNVGIGTATPAHRLSLIGGPAWTSNGWIGSLELSNGSALGWQTNSVSQAAGIGHSNDGIAFFRTTSSPGSVTSPASYDMLISNAGKVGIGTVNPQAKLHVVLSGIAEAAVFGENTHYDGSGVSGSGRMGVKGDGSTYGVFGNSQGGYGVLGESSSGKGVVGYSSYGDGVVGSSYTGYAGKFEGNVKITGTCCAAAANFAQIDHPLDPANRILQQALVESPDMKTVYDGNVTTDAQGNADVALPGYAETLNGDFRYQLTVVGTFAQAIVSKEVADNRFTIKTDKPNVKVSWQVTGIRKDPYAEQHRIQTEVAKKDGERGKYLNPGVYGQPESMGVDYEKRQAFLRR